MNLSWKEISWKEFEILTLHYAENMLPGTRFDEHLKQGSLQSGIDLIASQSADEPVCIQCKHEEKLSPAKVRELVGIFLKHKYAVPRTRFILATTAELRSARVHAALEEQRGLLKSTRNIHFEWWDRQTLATHLIRMWPIVERFFGLQTARDWCTPAVQSASLPQRLKPALVRGLLPIQQDTDDPIRRFWQAADGQSVQLAEQFTGDRLAIRRIGLIADPYTGKSICLRECANQLAESGQHIEPLFIDVKQENIEPIDQLLERRFRQWASRPLKNFVVIIDGLDEAHGNEVLAFAKYIDGFAAQFPSVSIILSCRRQFYSQIAPLLRSFHFYVFAALGAKEIDEYIGKRFDGHAAKFNKMIGQKRLEGWVHHPFYLDQMIGEFQRTGKLPATKADAIERFIEQAFTAGKDRSFGTGVMADRVNESRDAVQKLAMVLQLVGQNALEDASFQQLFAPAERDLLRQNPLVGLKDGQWSFANAFFQEHLAALELRRYPFVMIRDLLTIGKQLRKFRRRWLQTGFALLSLLDRKGELYKDVIQLFEEDSPEWVLVSEPTIHTPAFRVECLKRLIEYCVKNQLWPQLVYTRSIGQFFTGTPQAVAVLTGYLEDKDFPISIKIVCCRILGGIPDVTPKNKVGILALVQAQLAATADYRYAADLIGILSELELGSLKDVMAVMESSAFHHQHLFRDEVYAWISRLGLVGRFWLYGIEGIPILIAHNKPISQGGSERNLEAFLLSFTQRWQLYPLFGAMGTADWAEFYRYKGTLREGFVHQLLQKCADRLSREPQIAVAIAGFLRSNGRPYLREDVGGLAPVLLQMAGCDLLARCFGPMIFDSGHWELGSLVNPRSMDYLLWEFEQAGLPFRALQAPLMVMDKSANEMERTAYRRLIDQVSGGTLTNKAEIREFRRMQKEEALRIELDMTCIQSRAAFRTSVNRLFALHKAEVIDIHSLYGMGTGKLRGAASHFITQFINHWIMEGETASLTDCLEFLEDEEKFRYFRATEILQYQYEPEKINSLLLPLLKEYYYSQVGRGDYRGAAMGTNPQFTVEHLVVNIFSKYRFATPPAILVEFLWMDAQGIVPQQRYRPSPDLLRLQIEEALGDKAVLYLTDAVMHHLQQGIDSRGVLASHFALCDKLRISESQSYLLEALTSDLLSPFDLHYVADIYLRLGGDTAELLTLLDHVPPEEPLFAHLLGILADGYPAVVQEKSMAMVEASKLPERDRIVFAKIAIVAGSLAGFRYVVSLLDRPKPPEMYLLTVGFAKINTREALALIEPFLYLLVDPAYDIVRSPDNPRAILQDWLGSLAEKSEADLLLVLDALWQAEERLAERYANAINMRWYAFRLTEKLRDMGAPGFTVEEVKAFLAGSRIS